MWRRHSASRITQASAMALPSTEFDGCATAKLESKASARTCPATLLGPAPNCAAAEAGVCIGLGLVCEFAKGAADEGVCIVEAPIGAKLMAELTGLCNPDAAAKLGRAAG
jgi:hypothetical protein